MFLSIKSTKLLHLALFHLIDCTWNRMRYRGDFTVLYMPYLIEEVEIMLSNLIPYFHFKYSNEILLYFIESAKKEAKDNR